MSGDATVAQSVIARSATFYTAFFATGYYKHLGEEANQTVWRINPPVVRGRPPSPRPQGQDLEGFLLALLDKISQGTSVGASKSARGLPETMVRASSDAP